MGWLLDLFALLIIVFMIWQCARRGFVRTVIELIGYVASLVLAFTLSSVLANFVYTTFIRQPLVEVVENQLAGVATGSADSAVSGIFENLPGFVTTAAGSFGITQKSVLSEIQTHISQGAASAAPTVTDYIAQKIVVNLLSFIFLFILFFVFMLVVRIVARTVNKAVSIPVLGSVNRLLGGVIGVFKGVLIVFLIASLLGLVLPLTKNGIGFITPQAVEDSVLFDAIYQLNPLLK